MKRFIKTSMVFISLVSMVEANVTISSASYQEKVTLTPTGEKVRSWVVAQKVIPGTIIRYVNTVNNSYMTEANNLVIDNPIPENMEYVSNSALCNGGCKVSYSVDGGVTFHNEYELFIGFGEERHLAKSSEYTNIRWVLSSLANNEQKSVEYKARLK